MLILNPTSVSFGSVVLTGVRSLAVTRSAARFAESWGDVGPYATFADAPEVRVEIVIVQELADSVAELALPGEQAELSAVASPNASQARRVRLTTQAVLKGTAYTVGSRGPTRTLTFVAVSAEGDNPIALTDESEGA